MRLAGMFSWRSLSTSGKTVTTGAKVVSGLLGGWGDAVRFAKRGGLAQLSPVCVAFNPAGLFLEWRLPCMACRVIVHRVRLRL